MGCFHSSIVDLLLVDSACRFAISDSTIIVIISKEEVVVDIDPKDDKVFQVAYESAKSEYRRGIPFKPRKCWGKNVIFTPVNIR